MDSRITRIAVRQHGIVGRRPLLAAGGGAKTVDSMLQRGHLLRVSRGVYRLPGVPLTFLGEMMAAALRCGPDARVAGERILSVLGIRDARPDGPFVILTRPGREVTGVPWLWRADRAPGRDGAVVGDVPAVVPARNLLEVAVDADDDGLERIADGCRWRGGILAATRALMCELPHHPGTIRLAESGLVEVGAAESRPERSVDTVLADLGAERQVHLTPFVRVDFLFRGARLVVEYDGAAAHGGKRKREAGSARDEVLQALGYAVLHIRASDLKDLEGLRGRIVEMLAVLTTHAAG
jgi:very-short-patch-repair endonuclease